MKTMKDLAQEALDVQNACNLIAVVGGMHRAMQNLRTLGVNGTDELNNHHITRLWVDKVCHLSGMQLQDLATIHMTDAYNFIREQGAVWR